MRSGLITDIGKEACIACSRSPHVDTKPISGRCNCNLQTAWAQYIQGANRVFDRQIDAP
jgi:hypothetical protein